MDPVGRKGMDTSTGEETWACKGAPPVAVGWALQPEEFNRRAEICCMLKAEGICKRICTCTQKNVSIVIRAPEHVRSLTELSSWAVWQNIVKIARVLHFTLTSPMQGELRYPCHEEARFTLTGADLGVTTCQGLKRFHFRSSPRSTLNIRTLLSRRNASVAGWLLLTAKSAGGAAKDKLCVSDATAFMSPFMGARPAPSLEAARD
ncbi:hypothetical protein BDZ45DRAFT_752920 [Acephala macrosclerotiorum]|nr:hypothetical protein BDZ45DRAFT_752920 [Acephala macrosclerotiorum]